MSGTWYGQSATSVVYILATALERVDNDLLWLVKGFPRTPSLLTLATGWRSWA